MFCQPYGINSVGQVVGFAFTEDTVEHAVQWMGGTITDLGTLPGDASSLAEAINEAGTIVGASVPADGTSRAVVWENGVIADIGESSRYRTTDAKAINNSGEIVGQAQLFTRNDPQAVRFADGDVIDLDTEVSNLGGWKLITARSINDSGVIVGVGRLEGQIHGFMLFPQ